MEFNHTFLKERITTVKDGHYIHNNPDVVPALMRFAPDVVVTDGFNPTHLYAFAHAWLKGLPHVPMTDGTDLSERALSRVHKTIRRFVYARSSAFVSASVGGERLFRSYGIDAERCFKSYLCIDNDTYFRTPEPVEKKYDLIFCSRIVPEKSPVFALHVAQKLAKKLGRQVRMLFVGSGSAEATVRSEALLQPELVRADFHGFATQKELPGLYRSARLFLFPTLADVWGIVANEACAAGLPVIVSPHAGVAGELILDGQNGFICELDEELWAERAAALLTKQDMWREFSRRSQALVQEYTFDNAASGLLSACRFALTAGEPGKVKMPV
ncbi:glycosyltransferase family 4 protein [Noviherbaspirillum massiliense]|uniref:glycosyltransferase family 4 protein n=1 Tax=Noviherbaspirillum massiliense TaxID=1465823 RepID=UPI0002DE5822|nr:glycosyltransferase family 4 protein [Noviherbaspirillum massiliense]